MTKGDDLIYMLRNLRDKYRLSIRKKDSDKEVWYTYISTYRIISNVIIYLSLIFIIISATIIYTPILDLLPGYPGSKSRELLISNIMKIDSMEQKMLNISSYLENKLLITNGQTTSSPISVPEVDSTNNEMFKPIKPTPEDSIMRAQLDSVGMYKLPELSHKSKVLLGSSNLMSPVNGLVVNKFDPSQKFYGVEIATAGNKPIMSINDGSVIFATWTPELGNVIQIQHKENLVSTYKNATHILYSIGDIVKNGEVIGYTGDGISGEDNKGLMTFEIWHNGVPVDPEKYVWF